MLAVLVAGCGAGCSTAQASGAKLAKVEHWERVESLQPGAEINVFAGNHSQPDLCLVASVDSSTLTCLAEDAPSGTRLVFPRGAVRDVWVIDEAPERHIALWIGIAASAALEIWACVAGGAAGGVLMGAVIALVWAEALNMQPGSFWFPQPPRPPKTPQLRRRLVYQAPPGAVTP